MPGPEIPHRIDRLSELADNLWWSWHEEARDLFRTLDYHLWRMTDHNPVKLLLDISADKLQNAAQDSYFLSKYDSVMVTFDREMMASNSWFANHHSGKLQGPVAFFSAEFAMHSSLPIYAGGLGILSGDILKEANDLGLPMMGVGFMYPQGYFHQRISADGWQEEGYRQLNFEESPIGPCPWPQSCGPFIEVPIGDRTVRVGVWQVRLGRVKLYLMDSNVEGNSIEDRQLSARLYTADREQRMQQEILLGIGGVRVLRALGIEPSVWHANEGHTSFMLLERLREDMARGHALSESTARIKANSVFTTHTPVPAGHDVFPSQLMDKYFRRYWESMGVDRDTFLDFGRYQGTQDQGFNMTILALRLADHRTAVSKLHGSVTRTMWHGLWPQSSEDEVPITHITNGVHPATWTAHDMCLLYEKHLAPGIMKDCEMPGIKQAVLSIPDDELWGARRALKDKLLRRILDMAQTRWARDGATADQVIAMGSLLHNDPLTIGFSRRFTEYKRPALIFRDIERLRRIISDPWRPVQIVFAGKSHPADFPSKYLIHQVYNLAKDRAFLGRIAFIEDYDMHIAHYLVQGVDIWLNNPRRRQEASGTSGMKAAFNGVPNLSVLDGWWAEAYNGKNGWAIGEYAPIPDPEEEDRTDAEALYRLLENEVVPLYYERDHRGVPHGWLNVAKEAIASVMPYFSTKRMMTEYIEKMYLPAAPPPGSVPGEFQD